MALQNVTLTGKIPGAANAIATFVLSNWLSSPANLQIVPPIPDPVTLASDGSFSVSLMANDSTGIPAGSYWTIKISDIEGVPSISWSFNLLIANGGSQDLSSLATLPNPVPITPYMPDPSGTPQAGYVPVWVGPGQASAWGSPGAASIPLTTLGDTLYENATPTPTRLAGNVTTTRKFYRQVGNGTISAAPAWDILQVSDIPSLSSLYDAQGAASSAQSAAQTFATNAANTAQANAQALSVAKAGDTMTGKLSPTVTVVPFLSTVTLPVTTNVLSLTLTAACTINAPASANDGDLLRVRIIGANGHAVTWGTGWNWGTAGAPTLAGPRDRIVAEYVAGSTVWDASADLGHT